MNIKQRIDADLKTAMLNGDKTLVTTLRTLKSVILYAEVAAGSREHGLSDEDIVSLLQKEAKKRQESADLFSQGGNQEKSDAELSEIRVINNYLPAQIDDAELQALISAAIDEIQDTSPQAMGRIISRVKENVNGGADGGRIALAVKERLANS